MQSGAGPIPVTSVSQRLGAITACTDLPRWLVHFWHCAAGTIWNWLPKRSVQNVESASRFFFAGAPPTRGSDVRSLVLFAENLEERAQPASRVAPRRVTC